MKSSFWTPYISDHTIHAICWTLIHSLWIGLAIALLSGLVITITRKSSAALRYNLLCGILVLFTLSVWITFWIEMRTSAIEPGAFRVGQIINTPGNHLMIIPATTAPHLSLLTRIVWLLNQYASVIFLAWLLLFVLKSLKMAGGLLYIQRIRSYKVHEVSEEFKHKIEVFAGQIGIGQAVRLVQSELVKIPVAVGWLKPVILLPMGILLQLSPEQLESILWHELAHIRRRDYLVNILQGLVETVFFFNPGLLWLSSLIRSEREACCDDMVLSRTNRKANYLEALLAFGNEDNSRMPLAMSIGSGNQLRDRLKRIVNKENKRLSMAEKVVLIAGLVVLSAFTGLPKTTQNAVKQLVNVMIKRPAGKDTTKRPVLSADIRQGKPEMLVVKLDTPVRFNSVLFKRTDSDMTNNDIRAMTVSGIKYHLVIKDSKLVAVEVDGEKVPDSQLSNYEYMVTLIKAELDAKRRFRQQESQYAKLRVDRSYKKRYLDSNAKAEVKFYKDSLRFKTFNPDLKTNDKSAMNSKRDALRQRFRDDSISYSGEKNRALNVIADLVDDKVLPFPAAIKWFGLSDMEFIVNGQKQPDEMQQKYKIKYGISPSNGLYYGPVEMHGTGVFIDADPTKPPLPPGSPRKPKTLNDKRSGYMQPKYADTNAWKRQQLIKQQQAFADGQAKKREDIQRLQQSYLSEQQWKTQQKWKSRLDEGRNFKPGINLELAISGVIADLVSENVLKDKNDLVKFNLTNTALIVNGVKQSEALHEKLKSKCLQRADYYKLNSDIFSDPNFGLHFNAQNGHQGLGVTSRPDSP